MMFVFSMSALIGLMNFASALTTTSGAQNLVWCDTCHKFVPGTSIERSLKEGMTASQSQKQAPSAAKYKAQSGHN